MGTGIFEHLANIPLPSDDLIEKADLALAGLTNGGVLSPGQVRSFLSIAVKDSSIHKLVKVIRR